MGKNIKDKIYESHWWSVEYPGNWKVDRDDTCTTFLGPTQIGALQISSYIKEKKISENEILDFAKDEIKDIGKLKNLKTLNYQGYFFEYIDNEFFWMKYYLWKDRVMVYITYNCNSQHKNHKEITLIEEIVKTIKIKFITNRCT